MDKRKMTQCNCCGRELVIDNDIQKEDTLNVEKTWGYFSNKDGVTDRFIVCEACYDSWIANFAIRPARTETTELL